MLLSNLERKLLKSFFTDNDATPSDSDAPEFAAPFADVLAVKK